MEGKESTREQKFHYLLISFSITLSLVGLGYLDSRSATFSSAAAHLLIYSLPAVLIVYFFHRILVRRLQLTRRLLLSVLLGVPASFICMIFLLGALAG